MYKSCEFIQKGIVFYNHAITVCCSPRNAPDFPVYYIPNKGDCELDIEKILSVKKELIEQNKSGAMPPQCTGCPSIVEKEWETQEYLFNSIQVANDIACNFKCIYCNVCNWKSTIGSKNFYNSFGMVHDLLKRKLLAPDANVALACGEPMLKKNITELVYSICHYSPDTTVSIATNASIIPKDFLDVLKMYMGRITFNISLDSGSRAIFKQIKGVDKFETVLKNIGIYKKNGCQIWLKYIFLELNSFDVKNFINVAKEIEADSVIADMDLMQNKHFEKIPESVLNGISELLWEGFRYNIKVYFGAVISTFHEIIYPQIKATKLKYFDYKINELSGNSKIIKFSLVGRNEKSQGCEAWLCNTASDIQPVWSTDFIESSGVITREDPRPARDIFIILYGEGSFCSFNHHFNEYVFYVSVDFSPWGGVLAIEANGHKFEVDLYEEKPNAKVIRIDMIKGTAQKHTTKI